MVPGKQGETIPSATADALSMLQLLLDAGGDLGACQMDTAEVQARRRVGLVDARGDDIATTLSHAIDRLLRDESVTDEMLLEQAIQEVCTHKCIHVHTCTCAHTHVKIYIHIHAHINIRKHVHTYTSICMYTHAHTPHTHTYMNINININIKHININIRIKHKYTHKH